MNQLWYDQGEPSVIKAMCSFAIILILLKAAVAGVVIEWNGHSLTLGESPFPYASAGAFLAPFLAAVIGRKAVNNMNGKHTCAHG